MIIYEVNLIIKEEIYEEYFNWLLKHIDQLLQLPGFKKAEVGVVEDKEKKLRICYTIDSYEHLKNYLEHHASLMRAEGTTKFGDQFSATRRIISNLLVVEGDSIKVR